MIEVLRQHILARIGPQATSMDAVLEHFKCLRVGRNDQLLRQGDVCRHVYFIASGCLQVYIYDSSYNETTRDIITEDHWCSELISFGGQKPATENIRAIGAGVQQTPCFLSGHFPGNLQQAQAQALAESGRLHPHSEASRAQLIKKQH